MLSNNCSRKNCIGAAVKPTFRQTKQAAIAIAISKLVCSARARFGGRGVR